MNAPSERVSLREWVRSSRFEVGDVLGRGASGVVLRAFDRERAQEVALKVMRDNSPGDLRVLRREFDITRSLSHPGFVSVDSLFEDEDHPFFSMERVDGEYLVNHVCTRTGFDERKLRAAFAQLTRALRVLHRQGLVHRDVKPSNVKVTGEGRVVLLDLGLCAELDALEARPDTGPVGTAHYMAPEQATGDVSTASDLYALGVLLFRCLAGACPFEGPAESVLLRKQSEDPPTLRSEQSIPTDLERLCLALLSRDPRLRPSTGQILLVLEPERASTDASSSSSFVLGAVPLVGRELQLSAVLDACGAAQRVGARVWVTGAMGSGKSAFLRAIAPKLETRASERTWVFVDRCEPRPWLPYQGLSHAIASLAARLRDKPRAWLEELVPRDAHCLGEAFPAFTRVPAFALREDGPHVPDPVERRWRALLALRSLLGKLALERRLVFLLDDVHWADGDTLQLLGALLEPERAGVPRPNVAWVMTSGTHATGVSASATLTVQLSALSARDVEALADELLDPRSVDSVLGSRCFRGENPEPLQAVEVLRQAVFFGPNAVDDACSLDALYLRRIASLDPTALEVLEAVAVAGRPLSLAELAIVSDLDRSRLARVLGMLRALGLIVDSALPGDAAVEVPNLTLRAATVARLSKERNRELCLRLVAAAQSVDPRPSATLLRYQLGGEHYEAARRTAALAARAAQDVMAFEHAVHVYELASVACEGQPDDLQREVLCGMGEALACAGYAARAAASFSRASEGAKSADSIELRRRAAEYWLRSGHVDEALAALVHLLSEVSVTLPKRGRSALLSMLWQRAALSFRGLDFTRKTQRQLSARDLSTVDVLASVGSLIGLIDFVSGADFQTRAVREALHTGEPHRIAKALCVEASFASATESAPRTRAKRMVEIAGLLAEELEDPYLRGMVLIGRATIHMGESDFASSAAASVEAERLFRECCTGVTWELGQVQHMTLMALMQRGALRELVARAQRYEREALERGDLYGWTHILTAGGFMTPLVADQPEQALQIVSQAMARWPRESFHLQHFFELMALVQIELYQGGSAALVRLESAWPALRRSMLLRVPMIVASALWMLGLSLLSARTVTPRQHPDALSRVSKIVKQLRKVDAPHRMVFVHLLDAQLALLNGDSERARVLAGEGRREVERLGIGLFAERAEYLCGVLTAGEAGAGMQESALSGLREKGVVDPLRYVRQALPALVRP